MGGMLLKEPQDKWLDSIDQQDILAKSVRVGLSLCGPVGAIVGEFITQFVPRQRLDRLQHFTEVLGQRLDNCEEQLRQRISESASFAALVEETSVTAVRSASATRREDLAALLVNSLSKADAEMVAQQALLRILDALNDPQVLILMRYGSFGNRHNNPELEAFVRQHPEVFGAKPPAMGDHDEENARKYGMYRYYKEAMVALGVLKDTEGVVKSRDRNFAITELGRLVLKAIGRPVVVN